MTTWIKVFNTMPAHPKVLMAGDRAAWLHVCGICYCNEHLTDGFVADYALAVAAPGVKRPERVAQTLVEVGLWHRTANGWQIHNYLKHQRSAKKIKEERERDSERKAAARSGRTPGNVRAESGVDSDRSPTVEESRGEESREEGSSLRSDVAACFGYWQERCNHPTSKLTAERRRRIESRRREGYTVEQIKGAIDGAARAAFVNDAGKRFDDIELICRSGSKLEGFMSRLSAKPVNGASELDQKRLRASQRLMEGAA